MNANPYQSSAAVFDAAATGQTVPNFEAVGDLLLDLGRTTTLGPGVALHSTAVMAATKISLHGMRLATFKSLRSVIVLTSVAVLAIAVMSIRGFSPTGFIDIGGASPAGIEGGVSGEPIDDGSGFGGSSELGGDSSDNPETDQSSDEGDDVTGSSTSESEFDRDQRDGSGEDDLAEGDSTGDGSDSSDDSDGTSTTSGQPTTTTADPTTTSVLGEAPDTQGNNGNDNGIGVGNGKGNQGNGGGNDASGDNGKPAG